MDITINSKTLSLITGDIFALAKNYDSLFFFVHKGFNRMWMQYKEFLKTSQDRVWLIGVDEEKHLMSEVEGVVKDALDQLAERGACRIAMNAMWTKGEDCDNYAAQGLMIKACMSWLENNPQSSIQNVSLIDINPKKNFETAYYNIK